MIEDIIPNDDYEQLKDACNKHIDFNYNKNGLSIDLKFTPSGFIYHSEYTEPVQEELTSFTDYCESLNDELFVGICEYIGKDGLNKIQNCLDSGNIDTIRGAILYFKSKAKTYVDSKISEYEKIYKTL